MANRNYKSLIWMLTIVINGLIAITFLLPKLSGLENYDFPFVPRLNAICNALTFLSLLVALSAIKRKNIRLHRSFIISAFSFTSLFLVSYLLYHFTTPSVKYAGPPILR